MTDDDFTIDDLTPPAIRTILDALGGGLVGGIVLSLEMIGVDGQRRPIVLWDKESGLVTQLGLGSMMQGALDARRDCGWTTVEEAADDFSDG